MLIVSDALKQAFMEPERTIYVRIKIGNRTFDNDDVVSIEYDSGSLSGEVFAIGSTYSNSIKITFSVLVEGLKEIDEVTYEIGIKLPDGTIVYVPMGTFIINEAIEMDRNNNKTIIECMDRMVMMGGAYVSSLTYPAPIREVALEIANKAGVTVDVTSFERLSADRIAKPEGYTYREAIGLIAQFEAGFATFNRFGKLEIRTLSDPMFAIPPDNYFSKGLVKNEVFFRLGGISCTTDDGDTVIQSGNSAGNQVVLENRVMTKTLLDKIYQKIQTVNYYPFSLSWQGNPVLEAGDWIEVEDLQGNKFKTPNLNYSLSFSGGLSAKSSADTTTQSDVTYQYKSPLQQKLEWIQARIDAAGGNVVYEGIDEPANPKEGDLWFKIIGPDKEILVYKKDKDGNLFWDPQISTADINKVAKKMEKIIAQADADREAAEQNFEQAIVDAVAYTNLKAQEFDNQLIIVNQDLVIMKQSADSALTKADQAILDAGFAKVDAASAIESAATALTKVDNLSTDVTNVRTDLNGNITALNRLKTDVDGYQVTLADHTGKISTIQKNVSGLQTTVADKADKTQVTQLSNQWTQTTNLVNGHTSQISSLGTQINLRVTSGQVTEAILADKTILDTRNTNQSPSWYNSNYPRRSIVEFKDRAIMEVQGSSRFVQVTTESPWIGSSGGEIVQTAKSSDGTFQRSSIGGLTSWGPWEKLIEAGELISQINIQSGNILIQTGKLYLDTTSTHMTTAYVNDLKAKSLEAVYADIATLKAKVLTADVITSTMVKSDTALITKLFATDANVNVLTAKTAFINAIKATTITADKVTGGTANFANFNVINFNAANITSGTVSGANSAWNLNTGLMTFTNPSTNDALQLTQGQIQFQNGAQTRLLQYNAEGLRLLPGSGNTGTSRNTSLHLIGGGTGSYQYIQFASGDGIAQRLEAVSGEMILYHGTSGYVHLRKYGDTNDFGGRMIVARIETRHSTGVQLIIAGNSIETPRNGAMSIYLRPQGTGSVYAGDSSGTRYNMVASDFVKQSSRMTKTNIKPLENGMEVIRSLTPVSYNKIDKLNQGIREIEKGFISEDSPMVATPDGLGIYDSHVTAHLVKAVQELDLRSVTEISKLKAKIKELENKVK